MGYKYIYVSRFDKGLTLWKTPKFDSFQLPSLEDTTVLSTKEIQH